MKSFSSVKILLILPVLLANAKEPTRSPEQFTKTIHSWFKSDQKNPPPINCTMFIGSSSIRRWSTLAEDFPEINVVNRGFGGSKTSDILHFFDQLIPTVQPQNIVFYCGENDIAKGASPEVPANNWKTFVERVRSVRPDTKFYYIPIKPNPKRWNFWPKYQAANLLIEEYCKSDPKITYIGTIPLRMLASNGKPRPCIYDSDLLHLNTDGYKIWTNEIRKAILP